MDTNLANKIARRDPALCIHLSFSAYVRSRRLSEESRIESLLSGILRIHVISDIRT